jgi:hypothetical protein
LDGAVGADVAAVADRGLRTIGSSIARDDLTTTAVGDP